MSGAPQCAIDPELLRSPERAARREALEALSRSDAQSPLDEAVLAALLECLGDRAVDVQRSASDELVRRRASDARITLGLERCLEVADRRVRWAAAFTLARLGLHSSGLLAVLIETLADAQSDLRWAAREAVLQLGRVEPSIRTDLAAATRSGTPIQRRMAFYALRDLGGAAAEVDEALLDGLADPEPEVRLAALAAAGALAPALPKLAAAVIECLANDANPGVRRAATTVVTRIARAADTLAAAQSALEQAAQSGDPHLARAARVALMALEA